MYDKHNSKAAAMRSYSRCRTIKDFIFKDDAKILDTMKCTCCGNVLSNYGNAPTGYRMPLCRWIPGRLVKNGKPKITGMHYTCAWGQTFQDIENIIEKSR